MGPTGGWIAATRGEAFRPRPRWATHGRLLLVGGFHLRFDRTLSASAISQRFWPGVSVPALAIGIKCCLSPSTCSASPGRASGVRHCDGTALLAFMSV